MTELVETQLKFLNEILRNLGNDEMYFLWTEARIPKEYHTITILVETDGTGSFEEKINLLNDEEFVIEDITIVRNKIYKLISGKGCVENE